MTLLERVRRSCRTVADQSRQVRLLQENIPAYADRWAGQTLAAPPPDPRYHLLDQGPEAALAFFLILDAVNFGSGWFPYLQKPVGQSGYYTIAGALTDFCRRQGVLTPSQLRDLTAEDCSRLFRQEEGGPEIRDLMRLFSRSLNELGRVLCEDFEGSYGRFVDRAEGSAVTLVSQLYRLPCFQDTALYQGETVYFLKRAQITVADLHLAFGGQGYGTFTDLDQLTLFADNLVPHVLRLDGVLDYDPDLLARIERGELIDAGSAEEVEIRACAVTAVEAMVDCLKQKGHDVTAMALDGLLWHRGQAPAIKAHPRHRTRTLYY